MRKMNENTLANLLSLSEVLLATGGRLLNPTYNEEDFVFTSITIDSRNCVEGSFFVPLVGNLDGHDFILSAAENGAKSVFVSDFYAKFHEKEIASFINSGLCLISVSHTMYALQNMAAYYVEKFPKLKKVAITGSSGKTTTKEILVSLLQKKYKTVYNEGNLNSETGLPLSVFNIRDEHEWAVFEMGMNRRGEIRELAQVLKPNIAIITNIGSAHIGNLGTKDLIAEEKKSIFSFFETSSIAIIPVFDEYSEYLQINTKGQIVLYGNYETLQIRAVKDRGLEGSVFLMEDQEISFPLYGSFNFLNALAALHCAKIAGLAINEIKRGLEELRPSFGRAEIFNGEIAIVQDCYNANPESMNASIEYFETLHWEGRKILILADMLELGFDSEIQHRLVGKKLKSLSFGMIFLLGSQMDWAYEELMRGQSTGENTDEKNEKKIYYNAFISDADFGNAVNDILVHVNKGDLLLLKGSRGMKLERISEKLIKTFNMQGCVEC